MDDLGKRICKRYGTLRSHRKNWDNHWREVAAYTVPHKDDVYLRNLTKGEKKTNLLYDGTAIRASSLLAAALSAMLINPTSKWFGMTTGSSELDDDDEAARYFDIVTEQMLLTMNNSNFQQEAHESFLDLSTLATSVMSTEEDDEYIVRYMSRPIYEFYIAENNRGLVDSAYRVFKWTLRNIVSEFGEEALLADAQLPRQYETDPYREYEVIHAVTPSSEMGIGVQMPYTSVYILKQFEHTLKAGGFLEFPYAVSRWAKASDEVYGRGPAMECLPDIKMLNAMKRTMIRSAQKVADPPLKLPDDGVIKPVSTAPGAIIHGRAQALDAVQYMDSPARVDFGYQLIQMVTSDVNRAFFVDLLQLPQGAPQMTATEVMQRTEEKLRLLGPILGRQQFEFLRPVVNRTYNIMLRKGVFPPAPPILQGQNVEFVYTSMIAKAQKTSDAQDILRALEVLTPLLQHSPSSLDVIDTDKAVRSSLKKFGVDRRVLRSDVELEEMRNAQAEAAQAAQSNEQMLMSAEAMSKGVDPLIKAAAQEPLPRSI